MAITIVKELLTRFTGDTSDLDKSIKDANNGIDDFSKKAQRSGFSLTSAFKAARLATVGISGALLLSATTNERLRKEASRTVVEFQRLAKDIDQAAGTGDLLVNVFRKLNTGIIVIRAGVRSIGDGFTAIGLSAKQAFNDAKQSAEDFLNSTPIRLLRSGFASFGASGKDFNFAGDSVDYSTQIAGLNTYSDNLNDIINENQKLDQELANQAKSEKKRSTARNSGLSEQRRLQRLATQATEEATRAIQAQQREVRNLRTEFGDMLGDIAFGVEDLRSTALKVIEDVSRNLLKLSVGGESGGGIGGSIASSIFGALGGGGGAQFSSSGIPIPGVKPSFAAGASAGGSSFLGSSIGSFFGFSNGTVVNQPTMIGNNGVMAEKGPEAIMPLVRKNGKLGIASSGGGGNTTINNNNFSLGVQQTVRAEIAKMMPQISSASVGATQDAASRGQVSF